MQAQGVLLGREQPTRLVSAAVDSRPVNGWHCVALIQIPQANMTCVTHPFATRACATYSLA